MSILSKLPPHLRPRREKIFGPPPAIRLDRNAKARIWAFAQGWTAKHRQARQHRGPITRAFMEVLKTMLWGFHREETGQCFPSYDTIATRARCNRDTVYEALKVFEEADILTWVNRIARIKVQELDLFGHRIWHWQTIRTSNAYLFRDPLPCQPHREAYKSENPSRPLNQDLSLPKTGEKFVLLDPDNPLDRALIRLGNTMGAIAPAISAST